MAKIVIVLMLLCFVTPVMAGDTDIFITDKGVVTIGTPKGTLYEIFPDYHEIMEHRMLGDEWVVFRNWTTEDPEDVITFYLKDGYVTGWKEAFNPTPQNKGSIYEYSEDDEITVWFFPAETARWDGEKMNVLDWHMLTDFQKIMFMTEYVEKLSAEYEKPINLDLNKYVLAMNHYVDLCPTECLYITLASIVKKMARSEGKLEEEGKLSTGELKLKAEE